MNGPRLTAGMRNKVLEAKLVTIESPVYAICAREQVDHAPEGVLVVTAHDIFG